MAFVLPFATCAASSINGVVQAFKPCDVFNCQNPNYFDPCMFMECNRTIRVPTYGDIDTNTTTTTTTNTNTNTTGQ